MSKHCNQFTLLSFTSLLVQALRTVWWRTVVFWHCHPNRSDSGISSSSQGAPSFLHTQSSQGKLATVKGVVKACNGWSTLCTGLGPMGRFPISLGCTCRKEKDSKACSVLEWCKGIDPPRLHYQLFSKSPNAPEKQSLSTIHTGLPLVCKKMMRCTYARAGSWDACLCLVL